MKWPSGALKMSHMGKEEKKETNKSFVLNMKGSRKCDCWSSGHTAQKIPLWSTNYFEPYAIGKTSNARRD